MLKKFIGMICCLAFTHAAISQDAKFPSYSELPDPYRPDSEAWDTLNSGTYVSFGSPDIRYPKSIPPKILKNDWQAHAWRGERVHTQLLIWGTEPLLELSVMPGGLKTGSGDSIPTENIKVGFLRYVMTDELNENGGGCGHRPDKTKFDSSLVADAIDYAPSTRVRANKTQPIWLSIDVPGNTKPGIYHGSLRIKTGERKYYPSFVNYSIVVSEHTLPSPDQWTFHLDLWQSPEAIARLYEVKPWSKEHFDAMKPYFKMLADAGQKVITAAIIHDPWNSQTQDIFGSTVRWTKKKDGSWLYDFSRFDKWVNFMMECGIKKQINCYSMIPWNLKFYYYDESIAKDTFIVAQPGTKEFNTHWKPMLSSFAKHLKAKGWFDITNISMDERKMEDMLAVMKLVHEVDKTWKVSLAGTLHKELIDEVYDYCIASGQLMDRADIEKRLAKGWPTTNYTCCTEGYPNTFTFSPPAEAAWLPWYSAAKGYNGYLRWAYNNWVENPMQDSRFRTWAAGDCYFVYPGTRTSIRFERLREGIQDYEKIQILKKLFKKEKNGEKLAQLEALLAPFNIKDLPNVSAARMLEKAKKGLAGLE
ncbi:hypothetical protein COR50_08865 [Chitinophaga caeni]|uniref:Uncharacterized protein n=1 Tax=Chitinophaga caeni TaxID=2029983 RepID=A0A291QTT3_9BACT|nr:DUF4091 domain-containing protein [Chitinophaga caeni]ATL47273.1 hypothetical protein COR50_08865 [Chitinophaga caeni]